MGDNVMFWRSELKIGNEMIVNPPPVEHNAYGDKICPWRRTWMEGLQKLHDCNIYVKSSEPGDYNGAPPTGYSFREKYPSSTGLQTTIRTCNGTASMRRMHFQMASEPPRSWTGSGGFSFRLRRRTTSKLCT